jgi:predicted amidohydrolase YtcJ
MLTSSAVARKIQRISKVVFKWKMRSRAETLRGMMTLWAYSNFEEKEKRSLEVGKWADFVMYELMKVEENKIVKMKPHNNL